MEGFEGMEMVLETIGEEAEVTALDKPEGYENAESAHEKTYGCDHVSRVIGAPPQTVRNYTRDYDEFLTSGRGEKGQRTYTKKDMAILKKIHDLRIKEHRSGKEIRHYLENNAKIPNAVKAETEMIANAVSVELHDKIKAFFEIGMQGISKQVGRLSTHMDSMEGAVRRQKEEMRRLHEQNEELRQQVEENKKVVQLLSKDMERRAKEHLDALNGTHESILAIEKGKIADQIARKVEDQINRIREGQKDDQERLVQTIQNTMAGGASDEEKEQYEKARNALTKLAAEVDRKNAEIRHKSAQIEELLKEKVELQKKSKGFSGRLGRKKQPPSSAAVVLNSEAKEADESQETVKSLDSNTDYVNSLKKVAEATPQATSGKTTNRIFGLKSRLLKQQHA